MSLFSPPPSRPEWQQASSIAIEQLNSSAHEAIKEPLNHSYKLESISAYNIKTPLHTIYVNNWISLYYRKSMFAVLYAYEAPVDASRLAFQQSQLGNLT